MIRTRLRVTHPTEWPGCCRSSFSKLFWSSDQSIRQAKYDYSRGKVMIRISNDPFKLLPIYRHAYRRVTKYFAELRNIQGFRTVRTPELSPEAVNRGYETTNALFRSVVPFEDHSNLAHQVTRKTTRAMMSAIEINGRNGKRGRLGAAQRPPSGGLSRPKSQWPSIH